MTELIVTRALSDTAMEPIGDGWTIYGRAVPYGVDQRVSDDGGKTTYLERWKYGAFSKNAAAGGRWVVLFIGHRGDYGDRYLGRCLRLEEQDDGLYAEFRLERSHPRANEARAGELRGWSVGARVFRSRRERLPGGDTVMVHEYASLEHVAATPSPQYADAGVLATRDHEIIGPAPTPLLDELRARRARLDAGAGQR